MAQTLDQVYASLGSVYDPQANLIRQQQSEIPGQIAEEEKGLQAKQESAFGQILGGARQRGMGFSGIPLQEQAKYTASEFLPAVARLRQTGRQQATTLEEALLGINERRRTFAQQIRDGDLQREQQERQMAEQRRQFDLQLQESQRASRAAAGGGFSPSMGGGGAAKAPTMIRKQDGGFAFTDPSGRPISAAAYSLGTGTPFRALLQQMANQGDKGAKNALGFVGDDYGFNPGKIGNNRGVYNALTWGIK